MKRQCLNTTCKRPAPWTCRTCGRPVCANHSKGKLGVTAYCGCPRKKENA